MWPFYIIYIHMTYMYVIVDLDLVLVELTLTCVLCTMMYVCTYICTCMTCNRITCNFLSFPLTRCAPSVTYTLLLLVLLTTVLYYVVTCTTRVTFNFQHVYTTYHTYHTCYWSVVTLVSALMLSIEPCTTANISVPTATNLYPACNA